MGNLSLKNNIIINFKVNEDHLPSDFRLLFYWDLDSDKMCNEESVFNSFSSFQAIFLNASILFPLCENDNTLPQ